MAKLIVALAAALLLAQDRPQDRPGQDKPGQPGMDRSANQDLDRALSKAGEMSNYSANITFKKEGMAEKDSMQPVEIRVNEGIAHLKSGDLEAYRKGDVFLTKDGNTWKRLESSTDRRQPSDRPTDRPTDKGGDKDKPSDQPSDKGTQQPGDKGTQQPGDKAPGQDRGTQDNKNISVERLQSCRLPHEVLRDLKSSSFKQVRREDTEGSRVFSGELTDAAIRQLLAHHKKGAAGSDQTMAQGTGSARIWINGEGIVNKYELVIEHKNDNKDLGKTNGMDGKITKTVEIREIGSTKYEVPADAKKMFDAKSTDKPADRSTDRPENPTDKKDDKKND